MKGRITKFRVWKSNKGCFVGIDNGEADYLYNKIPKVSIGDTVEYDTGKPTDDGKPTISKLVVVGGPVEAFAQPANMTKPMPPYRAHDAPKADARETYWQNREKHDLAKDATITRLSCISSACELAAKQTSLIPTEELVIKFAKRFEKYAKDGV